MKPLALVALGVVLAPVLSFADTSCVVITSALKKGSKGAQVISLQARLASLPDIYPEGTTSGYFGALSEKAVQRFQARESIVTSGTPATTGFGVVGPRTRTAINQLPCGTKPIAGGPLVGWFTVESNDDARSVRVSAQVKVKEGPHTYSFTIGDRTFSVVPASSVCDGGICSHVLNGSIEQSIQGTFQAMLKVDGALRAERTIVLSGSILDRVAEIKVFAPSENTKVQYGVGLDIAWYATKAPSNARAVVSLVSESGTVLGKIRENGALNGQFIFTLPDKKTEGCTGSALECLASLAGTCSGAFCDLQPGKYRVRVELFSGTRSLGSAVSPVFTLLNTQGLPAGFGSGSFIDPDILRSLSGSSTIDVFGNPLPPTTYNTGAQCMYSGVSYAEGISLDVTCGDYYRQSCGSVAGQTVTCRNGQWVQPNGSTTVLQGVTGNPSDSLTSCRTPWGGQTVADGSQVPYQPYFTNGQFTLTVVVPIMQCTAGNWQKCNWDGTGCAAWNAVDLSGTSGSSGENNSSSQIVNQSVDASNQAIQSAIQNVIQNVQMSLPR